jgi:hypothetical protein
MKRAAELHDEALFKQPPRPDDCPICFLLLPESEEGTGQTYMTCCGKTICSGCCYAVARHGENVCPFCRAPTADSAGYVKRLHNRIKCNDASAFFMLGHMNFYGHRELNVAQDQAKGVKLWQRAGDLGVARAYCSIAYAYREGLGVSKDKTKARHYYELAAMGGNVRARHNLGCSEAVVDNMKNAIKHWIIAAGSGSINSLYNVQHYLLNGGFATKSDYERALRAYQQHLNEVRSVQRDEAAVSMDDCKYLADDRPGASMSGSWTVHD